MTELFSELGVTVVGRNKIKREMAAMREEKQAGKVKAQEEVEAAAVNAKEAAAATAKADASSRELATLRPVETLFCVTSRR